MLIQVADINALSGTRYFVKYDTETGTITVEYINGPPVDSTLTPDELGYDEGDIIYQTCRGTILDVVYGDTDYPFATVTSTADAPECVVVPPPPPDPTPSVPTPITENYIAYQVKFKNFEGNIVEANIFDQMTYQEGRVIEYRPLRPSGEPVRIECIDNDEDKFTSIRAKQCIIEFNSGNTANLNLFSEGQDNRWYVEVKVSDEIKFKGFLVLNDMQEDFLSPPNIVSLTAIDGLGTLKDTPLVDFDGEIPRGKYRWIDYLGWALRKSGLTLPINLEHNLREQNHVDDPFFMRTYLDAKTFEGSEVNTRMSCYDVLETLLAKECFVTQRNGEWWVVRVDEMTHDERWVWIVDTTLTYAVLTNQNLDKTIKKTEDIKWIDRSAYVKLDRPHGFIKEQFNFNLPKEIIDNIDFARGGQILVGVYPPNENHYHLEDWTLFKDNLFAQTAGTGQAEIVRIFDDNDYEKERYMRVAGNGAFHWLKSNPVPMGEKDKFNISVDFRSVVNTSGGTLVFFIQILLTAGSVTWIYGGLHDAPPESYNWTILTNTIVQQKGLFIKWEGSSIDERLWQTLSFEVKPLPIDGDLTVILTGGASSETQYQNLQFDYIPYINGSYQRYNGQYWKVSQTGTYKAVRDEEVFISDSPRPLFNGAMRYFDAPSGTYPLTERFQDYSTSNTPIAVEDMRPYGWYQAQAVWNQYRRVMRILDGELLGITENDLPDLIHRYTLGDPSPHTNSRYFICLHYSMSLKSCKWSGYFAEVYKTGIEKVYDDPTEFKYLEAR